MFLSVTVYCLGRKEGSARGGGIYIPDISGNLGFWRI
jgi:hypothetical protein